MNWKKEALRLKNLIDSPEINDFISGVQREASHQTERWGSNHDDGKTPADWFWLVAYLAGKALHAFSRNLTCPNCQFKIGPDLEKGMHHIISTAAVLCNWHSAVLGKNNMRPGIKKPDI